MYAAAGAGFAMRFDGRLDAAVGATLLASLRHTLRQGGERTVCWLSNELADDAYFLLDRFSDTLSRYPYANIIVKGYTDVSGSVAYNKKLSEFRANIVKGYLVGKGISPERIRAMGMGPGKSPDGDITVESIISNRRVEVQVE